MEPNFGKYRKIRLEDLYVFKVLCEYKNYSKAAEALDKTQGSVSTIIKRLEEPDNLGVMLINRTSRTFRITREGKMFLKFCEDTLSAFENLIAAFQSTGDPASIRGIIRVTSSTIPEEFILPELLARFKREYPKIEFKITLRNSRGALQALLSNRADFAAIGMPPDENILADYDALEIGEDELVFVCSAGHHLTRLKDLRLSDLFLYPFVLREQGSGTRYMFESSDIYPEDLNIALILDSNNSIINTIRSGDYIGVLSALSVKPYLNGGQDRSGGGIVILKPVDYTPIRRKFYLLKRKTECVSLPNRLFWDFCAGYYGAGNEYGPDIYPTS